MDTGRQYVFTNNHLYRLLMKLMHDNPGNDTGVASSPKLACLAKQGRIKWPLASSKMHPFGFDDEHGYSKPIEFL